MSPFSFAERIDSLVSMLGLSQRAFSEKLGLAPSSIAQAKRRGAASSLLAAAICSVFGVDRAWLETGEGEMFAQGPAGDEYAKSDDIVIRLQQEQIEILREQVEDLRRDKERLHAELAAARRGQYSEVRDTTSWVSEGFDADEKIAHIPIFDVAAAAGREGFVSEEPVRDYLPFRETWIATVLGSYPENLVGLRVEGDSMEPKLRSGDVVLVDRVQHEARPLSEGVYLFRYQEDLLIKHLRPQAGGGVEVISYNPKYEPFLIHPAESEAGTAAVLGKVVWPLI